MTVNQPLVSVAVLTYQHEAFIGECLQSILDQSYDNIEIIVGDDGSTDKSRDIIKYFAEKSDKIKTIFWPVNVGVAKNFRKIIENCTGEYICILEGDDKMYPGKLQKQIAFLEENPEYDICLHNVDVYDDDTKTYVYKWLDRHPTTVNADEALFTANWFFEKNRPKSPSASRLGRTSYMKNGIIDYRTVGEFIYVLGMHAAKPHAKWYTIPETLGMYRLHGNNISRKNRNWENGAQHITVTYGLARIMYPQFSARIKNEEAFWWFNQLLYNQIPKERERYYRKKFREDYGIVKYLYLVACKLLLGNSLSGARKIINKFRGVTS